MGEAKTELERAKKCFCSCAGVQTMAGKRFRSALGGTERCSDAPMGSGIGLLYPGFLHLTRGCEVNGGWQSCTT
jgi:hypothetical protein